MQKSIFLEETNGIEFVKPFAIPFYECHKTAMGKLNLMLDINPQDYYNRTKINLLYDIIVKHIKSTFPEDKNTKDYLHLEKYNSLILFTKESVAFSF